MRTKNCTQRIYWTVIRTYHNAKGEKINEVEIFSKHDFAYDRVSDLKLIYPLSEIQGPLVSFMSK